MADHNKPRIVVIAGPTGIGKTGLSLALARTFRGAVVGADSMQIYRHMDIGTAKPNEKERREAEHYMIDVAAPDEPFDAARYARMARDCIDRIQRGGKLPLVVGGTGFYIKALLYGLFASAPADPGVRKQLMELLEKEGAGRLHERLCNIDPEAGRRIHPNDRYRMVRALEVYEVTGALMSARQGAHRFCDNPFHALKIGLYMERERLYTRIDKRVAAMVEEGLLEEVKRLLASGYTPDLRPMQSLGYRHMCAYISGGLSWDEALLQMRRDTRRYAKRQLTWFRKDPEIIWKRPEEEEEIFAEVGRFLKASDNQGLGTIK